SYNDTIAARATALIQIVRIDQSISTVYAWEQKRYQSTKST
ncbi:unnamed protein product, partial [marine sediment metagenome]